MARIAGIDLPREKRIEIGLTYIYGIGATRAKEILAKTGIDADIRVKDLTDDQEAQLREVIEHQYLIEGDLRRSVAMNIKRLSEIGCYRGLRHRRGLPVHGQRTKTNAYQNNSNIVLTDKAKINTMPFLEIYADDVKCGHGATVGQLNPEALFYLRTRCISERSARMLLMYAFCEDVLSKSDIEELKENLGDLIKRRLQGELTACGNCVFQCSTPKFKI